ALWLARFHQVQEPLVVQGNANTVVLTTQDANLSNKLNLGGILTVGFNFDQVSAFEFTYFGLNHWSNTATVTDPAGKLQLAGSLPSFTQDFAFANKMVFDYKSRFQNAEGNYKQTIEGMTL